MKVDVKEALKSPEITGNYNELVVRKWTIGALFYTKGVQIEVIEKLKDISNEYSFKEYINPKWINRLVKFGVPKMLEKNYPIYEIDIENKKINKVYEPTKEEIKAA
ncbi:MAG: hypothetical protein PF569_00120 [Candidatus Woesearchaeota archaeon]|jgi:hypothetical protein|nr:hypothetical protein [Candidatus Woesearchaeota archaeon]